MKYLIITEGSCEKAFLEVMIEKGIFRFDLNDLLYEGVHVSQAMRTDFYEMINQLDTNEKITIIRVKDKFSGDFSIDEEYKDRIEKIIKVRTSPEIEMLHILYLGLFDEYIKVKSTIKPCEFLPQYEKDYCKTYSYNYSFFNKLNSKELVDLLHTYEKKRKRVHNEDEKALTFFLKEE